MECREKAVRRKKFKELLGGSPKENKIALLKLLDGEKSAYRDSVILNSAAAILISGKTSNLLDGAELASESIDSGAAKFKLDSLIKATNGY